MNDKVKRILCNNVLSFRRTSLEKNKVFLDGIVYVWEEGGEKCENAGVRYNYVLTGNS